MHGIRRTKISAEALEARRVKERAKLEAYLKLTDDVLTRKKSCDWSAEALGLTSRLLTQNPEFYTIWNYRRDIFINEVFPNSTPEEINEVLSTDLDFTMSFLREHPKVYWIWNHRQWCLENVPDSPGEDPQAWRKKYWAKEMFAVEKMLEADARNFLAWNYRRYVLSSMPVKRPETAELAFTTGKIEANFSNFSAWHQRTKVLASLWEKGELDEKKTKDEEFEFVKQAFYVDPYDQSSWIYHRWLIGTDPEKDVLSREISMIKELDELEPNCKWCLESLQHYQRLYIKLYLQGDDAGVKAERERLTAESRSILKRLAEIDPYRERRYQELAEGLQSS